MRRGRGNRRPKAAIEERRARAVRLMSEGKNKTEAAAELGVGRMTLWRDLRALEAKFGAENSALIRELKAKVADALLKAADEVWEGKVPPDVAGSWRSIVADFSKLLGLNAESRSVVAHVSVEADPSRLGLYNRFLRETKDVPPERFEELWALCRRLRVKKDPAAMLPPAEIQGD